MGCLVVARRVVWLFMRGYCCFGLSSVVFLAGAYYPLWLCFFLVFFSLFLLLFLAKLLLVFLFLLLLCLRRVVPGVCGPF